MDQQTLVFASGTYQGQVKRGKMHGKGTFFYTSGNKYEGDFQDGQRTGIGFFTYANGDRYEGEFLNNNFHGRGTFYHRDGTKFVGEFRYDRKEGRGMFYYNNGDRFETLYRNDMQVGDSGVLYYANGDKYEGTVLNGQKHGEGIYTFSSGNRYIGGYRHDTKHGKGRFENANGDVFVCEFHDGAMHGKGMYTYANGNRYEAVYENGSRVGPVRFFYANGDRYEGGLENERRSGQGVYWYKNGDVYTGEFQNDLRHGYGGVSYANGDRFEGHFRKGERHGHGRLTYANSNSWREGEWRADRKHGTFTYHDPENNLFTETYKDGVLISQSSAGRRKSLKEGVSSLIASARRSLSRINLRSSDHDADSTSPPMATADTRMPSSNALTRKNSTVSRKSSTPRFNEIDVLEHVSSPKGNGTRSLPPPLISSMALSPRKGTPLRATFVESDEEDDADPVMESRDRGLADSDHDEWMFEEEDPLPMRDSYRSPLTDKTSGRRPMKLLETAERWRAQADQLAVDALRKQAEEVERLRLESQKLKQERDLMKEETRRLREKAREELAKTRAKLQEQEREGKKWMERARRIEATLAAEMDAKEVSVERYRKLVEAFRKVQNERRMLMDNVESLSSEKEQLADQTGELRRQADAEISTLRAAVDATNARMRKIQEHLTNTAEIERLKREEVTRDSQEQSRLLLQKVKMIQKENARLRQQLDGRSSVESELIRRQIADADQQISELTARADQLERRAMERDSRGDESHEDLRRALRDMQSLQTERIDLLHALQELTDDPSAPRRTSERKSGSRYLTQTVGSSPFASSVSSVRSPRSARSPVESPRDRLLSLGAKPDRKAPEPPMPSTMSARRSPRRRSTDSSEVVLQVYEETEPVARETETSPASKLQQQLAHAQQELRQHMQRMQREAQQHVQEQGARMHEVKEHVLQRQHERSKRDTELPASMFGASVIPSTAVAHTPRQVNSYSMSPHMSPHLSPHLSPQRVTNPLADVPDSPKELPAAPSESSPQHERESPLMHVVQRGPSAAQLNALNHGDTIETPITVSLGLTNGSPSAPSLYSTPSVASISSPKPLSMSVSTPKISVPKMPSPSLSAAVTRHAELAALTNSAPSPKLSPYSYYVTTDPRSTPTDAPLRSTRPTPLKSFSSNVEFPSLPALPT